MAGSVKANKNQTAAERAIAASALSGKTCSKCGSDIQIKDLLNVVHQVIGTKGKKTLSYHRRCYNA